MADSVALDVETDGDIYEPGLHTRALTHADLEVRGDGRTVYGLVVPFDREASIEGRSGKFKEVFRHGAFTRSINAGVQRVKLFENHNHLRGDSPVGVATMLREDRAGMVGEFRIGKSPDGDVALQKIHDGIYDAFSVGFSDVPGKSIRSRGGVIERTEVKLQEVSLVSYPAYGDAAISGVRAAFPELTPEVLERLLALAHDLDTRQSGLAESTPEPDPSIGDDPAVSHSSTETGAEAPSPLDTSFAARQQRARQIDARYRGVGKRA